MKKNISILLLLIFGFTIIYPFTGATNAVSEEPSQDEIFTAYDEAGNVTYISIEDVELPNEEEIEKIEQDGYQVLATTGEETEVIDTFKTEQEANQFIDAQNSQNTRSRSTQVMTTYDVATISADKYSVVLFQGGNVVVNYTNHQTGISGYTNPAFAPDAAYLGEYNGEVLFKQAGVIGRVSKSSVAIVPASSVKMLSHYYVSGGYMYHVITTNLTTVASTQRVGYAPNYMQTGVIYYSYDGHYFYNNYNSMIDDYTAGTSHRAVNASSKYYNYYQFLPHRSTTQFTASQIDEYLNAKTSSSSKLRGLGSTFISNQNDHGVNAVLMLGVAINESAWGNSYIAHQKNNLFGHNATDSNPYGDANGYASPALSVAYHADYFVSRNYVDPSDWRYFGSHLGDKQSGMNVKYASDPYWGEKAATRGYYLEEYFGMQHTDSNKYTIGIVNGNKNVYGTSTLTSTYHVYGTGASNNAHTFEYPVVVLDTVGSAYKIQSDTDINSSRTDVVSPDSSSFNYDLIDDVAYISKGDVTIVDNGSYTDNSVRPENAEVIYRTHVQYDGWHNWVADGEMSGTSGESKRLEGILMEIGDGASHSGGIMYQTHIQDVGWQDWKHDGAMSGTSGQEKRLEAIRILLTGDIANYYDVYYRVHVEGYGWLDWTFNGNLAGTATYGLRLEGIEVQLVAKGQPAPGSTDTPYIQNYTEYQTHVQYEGWQVMKTDMEVSGTSGKSLRLEAINIDLTEQPASGDLQYRTHIEDIGWETTWKSNGQNSGTSGQSKRLEAIQIKLTGEMEKYYDVYYRVHAQYQGWLGWAKNGESAGTEGLSLRLEGIQVVVVPKGDPAPGSTENSFVK